MRAMILTALMGLVSVGGEVAPELAKLRETYAAAQAKIEGDRAKAVEKAVAGYEGELRALLANVRQQGDLDYVTAVQGELKRLETDRTAPAEPAAKRMTHLRAAQWGTRQAQDKADKERGEKLTGLAGEYAKLLAALEKQLVADNRIADAKMAREERAGLKGNDVLIVVSGPAGNVVEYKQGEKTYADYRRVWGAVPPEFKGWQTVCGQAEPSRPWVVKPEAGKHAYALVPTRMADSFSDWEVVRDIRVEYGQEFRAVWLIMRKMPAANGEVSFPGGLTEDAFPLYREIVR